MNKQKHMPTHTEGNNLANIDTVTKYSEDINENDLCIEVHFEMYFMVHLDISFKCNFRCTIKYTYDNNDNADSY